MAMKNGDQETTVQEALREAIAGTQEEIDDVEPIVIKKDKKG